LQIGCQGLGEVLGEVLTLPVPALFLRSQLELLLPALQELSAVQLELLQDELALLADLLL